MSDFPTDYKDHRDSQWALGPSKQESATREGVAASITTNITRNSTVGPPKRPINPVVPAFPVLPRTLLPENAPFTRVPFSLHGNASPFLPSAKQSAVAPLQPLSNMARARAKTQLTMAQSHVTAKPSYRPHPVDPFTPASHTGGRRRYLGPQLDRNLNRHQYEPGMIIRAPLHEAHFDERAAAKSIANGDPSTTQSRFGPVYHKARPMIVVIMHEDHYVAVPCFTYQGKGIGAKNADDHVSIHDCRSKGPVPRQTKHSTLEVGYMYDGTDIFDERSVAHFAYPICRPYSELYRQTIPPSPSTKAANDAQKAKLVKERDRVLLATQAAAELTAALARKEKTTPVVAQLVQPLRDTLKAKEEQVEALVTLLSGLNM